MKLRIENGQIILTDGDKQIMCDTIMHAMCYMFLMFNFRSIPCVARSIWSVRSLTPNPKPIELTYEDKLKIAIIKGKLPMCKI